MGLDLCPPEPSPLPPLCGRHKWMALNQTECPKRLVKKREENWICSHCCGLYFDNEHPEYNEDWILCVSFTAPSGIVHVHCSCTDSLTMMIQLKILPIQHVSMHKIEHKIV